MPKKRFELSTKQEKLIEVLSCIPTPDVVGMDALVVGIATYCKETAFDAVCDALLILGEKTQSEDICRDTVEKAKILYMKE